MAILLIGAGVGFLAGMFGKGGSAVATPLLHAVGVPAMVAVAAPLPATIPSTMVASWAYWRQRFVDDEVLRWSLAFGVPATVVGALASRWVGGGALVRLTDVIVAALGVRFLVAPSNPAAPPTRPERFRTRLVVVAVVVGVAAGLLANSGGFLLAPLYLAVLRLPIRSSFGSSLAVSGVLAIPGTAVHWALGHIDWRVVFGFGVASIPFSWVGAAVALRTDPGRLERLYGAALATLGTVFLVAGR